MFLTRAATAGVRECDDGNTPDIATASEAYASRFSGPVGAYLLEVQNILTLRLVGHPGKPLHVLDLGGGHAQLTASLLATGHEIVVQGSAPGCAARLRPLLARHAGRLHFVVSRLWQLPFPDRTFDVVLAIRLLGHIDRLEEILAEMARLSRHRVIVDFPPRRAPEALAPWLLRLKGRMEDNACLRPFVSYSPKQLYRPLEAAGFGRFRIERELLLPMALHRWLGMVSPSRALEAAARTLGLTAWLGGPALLAAERLEAPVPT
jgi:SAM-dependent methyltransferase